MQPLPSAFRTLYCSSWLIAWAIYPRLCCRLWGRRCGRISGWSPHFNEKRRFDAIIWNASFALGIGSQAAFCCRCGKACCSFFSYEKVQLYIYTFISRNLFWLYVGILFWEDYLEYLIFYIFWISMSNRYHDYLCVGQKRRILIACVFKTQVLFMWEGWGHFFHSARGGLNHRGVPSCHCGVPLWLMPLWRAIMAVPLWLFVAPKSGWSDCPAEPTRRLGPYLPFCEAVEESHCASEENYFPELASSTRYLSQNAIACTLSFI
jgi:hypothetical protein